jgi:hypothetical protein
VAALVEDVPQWAELALAGLLVVCVLWLAARYVRWATTSFAVTSERLVLRKGFLRRTSREIRLDSLTDISCSQSLTDRLLRCGDILLESPGRDSQEVFPDLPRPVGIQNEIYRLLNQRQAMRGSAWQAADPSASVPPGPGVVSPAGADVGGGGAPVAGGQQTVADQLSQLDDLRRRGVISRREFAAKKAELLSRM